MAGISGGGGGLAPSSPPQRRLLPAITLPRPPPFDTELISGPMTLVSNFFYDHYAADDDHLLSLSQLLSEAPPSPAAQNRPPAPLPYHDSSSNCREISQQSYCQNQQVSDPQSRNSMFEYVISIPKSANDGYNWRKYGQKYVKTSKLPRCYYKCTQNNCRATKKVEHFIDGGISEIIYNGEHNHEPPPSRKWGRNGVAMDQHASFVEEPANICQQVNQVVANEVEGDASNLKTRKTEFVHVDWARSSRIMVTEPKIVVQTRSDIDVLDDGFKWRKYGQKVVKGNKYPRSYFKCSYVGCKVRKHVERVSSDPKSVVTTYEGKHIHDTPMLAKHSSISFTNFKTERPPTFL